MQKEHNSIITLAHGNGGKLTHALIESIFVSSFKNQILCELSDSALVNVPSQSPSHRIAFSTDSYVVKPLFFPGGDIGTLAVSGTVNDISVTGATPLYLSASFIIEEGLPVSDFKKILASIKRVICDTGIKIVTGDTKVVGKGSADKIFINTSGIGVIENNIDISQ